MQLTNRLELPEALYRAVANDPYSRGDSDITATQLIQPPRKVALEERYASKLTEDVSDRIWALCGQIGHLILERAAGSDLTEHRLSMTMHGWKISAAVDLWKKQWIYDYKFTSSYAVKEGPKEEWIQQLNIQRLICHENGLPVENLQIVCILRDWSKLEAKRNSDYPSAQVQLYNLPVWPLEETREWVSFAVLAHQAARNGTLPECTDAERWAKPPVWALRKTGAARATKLYYDELAAAQALADAGKGYDVEFRPGEWTRCESYCMAAPQCDQFQKYKAAL